MDPSPSSASLGTSPPDPRSLEHQVHALRLTLQVTLVSLVILSGALGIYLFRQVSLLRRQVETNARVAHQMATHFNLNVATQAMVFERQLVEFAKTNEAFRQRLTRFYPSNAAPQPHASAPPSPTP
ncbi:MAG: hypothetical protein KF833_24335 [Verrucomicrobiae bacterium]|nr:hypothetical protein [Verrucomicrobiae bacterium]